MIHRLGDIIQGLPIKEAIRDTDILTSWEKLVGEQISMHCRPERLKDGILFLRVDSPVWSQQLQFMKSMIIEKVNTIAGGGSVKDLRFQIGQITTLRRRVNVVPWQKTDVPTGEILRIEQELKPVRDPEVREALRRLLMKDARMREWRRQQRRIGGSSSKRPE